MITVCNDSHGNFILYGFSNRPYLEKVLFGIILVFYCLTLAGNAVIILVSLMDPKLQMPMYFFLSNLSLIDICFTSSCVPQILVNFGGSDKIITFHGCATQLYIFLWLGATKCALFVVIALDRYIAVCHPLRYTTVMHPKVCLQLAVLAWGAGLIQSLIQSSATLRLPFCSHQVVDDIVCEVPALIQLSSEDTTYNEVQMSITSVILLVLPLIIILSSYGAIVKSVMKIKSSTGQKKAFGTCTSHLLVVSSVTGVYLQPKTHYAHKWGKFLTLFYTVIIPTLNPLIYTLRNKEQGSKRSSDKIGVEFPQITEEANISFSISSLKMTEQS